MKYLRRPLQRSVPGSIPTELSSLTQLQELCLGWNQLTGKGWDAELGDKCDTAREKEMTRFDSVHPRSPLTLGPHLATTSQ